ncbi:putative EamA domain-containing protein [Rosa chinensis]|uniref:WAT1-related protein n=1 Tax=Rosa chinensis TaxID=74649 RepID=A0A2P6PX61_ROSCH|nr:WAT1-related protein At4g08290 [Rosa chinensis]PRQ26521.1 putative EamA domain-containing protein [Rosa chinensis]
MSSNMWKKAKPYLLTIGLQFGSAGMYIISTATLNHGMNRYVLIVYRNAIAALVLAPFALVLERKTRPKMTLSIFFHIMVLGFLEPVLDQGFAYLGMKYTSASFTSAIMNAVPSVTFVISVIFRIEHVNIKEVRSQAKVMGTLVTFGGALLMAMYKGPAINLVGSHDDGGHHESSSRTSSTHWAMGTLFILIGCVAWSCFYVLQSVTVKKYPANISLSCWICSMGAMQGAAVAFVAERHPSAWAVGWDTRLLAPLYTGIVSSGITYYVQGLVMKTRGPVFVTAFNPLCMILVAILASFVLAEKLHLGSIIGGFIIAIGLYAVVWGKSKDYSSPTSDPTDLKDENEAHKLPITTINGTKLTIIGDKNSSNQPAEMQYMTVQK